MFSDVRVVYFKTMAGSPAQSLMNFSRTHTGKTQFSSNGKYRKTNSIFSLVGAVPIDSKKRMAYSPCNNDDN